MTKAFDITKFRKDLTKNIDGLGLGFNDPKVWLGSGNYTLNYLMTGTFDRGFPLGKITIIAGESGSGKSYLCAGVLKEAAKQKIFSILIDTESSLDETWLQALGVDTSEDKMLKINMSMIDDVAKSISVFMKNYRETPPEDRPKVLFIIDSLGMLMTPTDVEQFNKGDLKGDLGRKPKALAALVRNCVNMFGEHDVGMICTNHTYASMDMFSGETDVVSGGNGPIYSASIVLALKKFKLKEDANGDKTRDVKGIRVKAKLMKSRFSRPFSEVEMRLPYDTGLDPYSGLFELFFNKEIIKKDGTKYTYTDKSGKVYKMWEYEFNKNEQNVLDTIMRETDSSTLGNIEDLGLTGDE